MQILEALPSLIKIDTDLPSVVALALFETPPKKRIQDSSMARGSQLLRLLLTSDAYESTMTRGLVELSGVDRADGPDLRDMITSMENLQYLGLCEALA